MPSVNLLPFLQNIPPTTRYLTLTLLTLTTINYLLTYLITPSIPSYSSYSPSSSSPNDDGSGGAYGNDQGSGSSGLGMGLGLRNGEWRGMETLPYLVLIPGKVGVWWVWTVVTSGFVEVRVWDLLLSLPTLPLASRYLERVWGPKELLRFALIVIVASNVIGWGFCWLGWGVTGGREFMTSTVRGPTALLSAYLVAFTQLIPEHQVQLLGRLRIRVKHLPGIFLLVSNILTLVDGLFPWMLIQFGFIVGWWYLRFFQPHGDGDFRGDRSETFAFIYWFPPPVRGPIGKVGNIVFSLATRLRIVQPWDASPGAYTMLPTAGSGAGGASTRAEAERRRALALKALDARVASTGAPPTSSGAVNSSDVSAGGESGAAAKEAVPEDGTGVSIFKESGDKGKE